MSEWWTYHLSDFLLFSSSTYYRLFEFYNAAIWPAQVVAVGMGLSVLALLRRREGAARGRLVAAILAACWLWIAIAFHASRYATINWAAVYFAWAFGLEAVLLVWVGVIRGGLRLERQAGTWIFFFALLVAPFIGPLLGRSWRQVEVFGIAPDPTAVATLGVLLAGRFRLRWLLMIIPLLWCAITGATLLAMKAPDFWIAPLASVVALLLAAWQRRTAGLVRDPSLSSR